MTPFESNQGNRISNWVGFGLQRLIPLLIAANALVIHMAVHVRALFFCVSQREIIPSPQPKVDVCERGRPFVWLETPTRRRMCSPKQDSPPLMIMTITLGVSERKWTDSFGYGQPTEQPRLGWKYLLPSILQGLYRGKSIYRCMVCAAREYISGGNLSLAPPKLMATQNQIVNKPTFFST